MASPSSATDPAARPPECAAAPLLRSLLPLAAGILAARAGMAAWALAAALVAAAALLALSRPACGSARRWVRLRPVLLTGLPSLLCGVLAMQRAAPAPHPDWALLPPREARVLIEVRDLFTARKQGRVAGTGVILRTDIPHDTVRGRVAAFHLEAGPLGGRAPGRGEVLECRAVLTCLPALAELDSYQLYLQRRDIHHALGRGAVVRLHAPAPAHERLRRRLYMAAQEVLLTGCDGPADAGNVVASMVLGSRALLSEERVDLYRRTGTYHLFAVSGMNVACVALCLGLVLRLARLPAAWRAAPLLAGTWGYVWLTGASPSALRAGMMVTCVAAARLLPRQPHLFPALALSAWLALLLDPRQLFDLGFQLSYAVVACIILVGLPLAREARVRLEPPLRRWPRLLQRAALSASDLVVVSLSAGLGSTPLIVQHFSLVTPGGMVAGILLNPLAGLAVVAGCAAMLAAPLAGATLAGALALAAWPAVWLMELLLEACLLVPGAVCTRAWPWPPAGTCLLAALLGSAWLLQRLRQAGCSLPVVAALAPHALVVAGLALTVPVDLGT